MTEDEKKAQEKIEQEKSDLFSNVESKAAEATKKEIENFKNNLPDYATQEDIASKYKALEETINKLGISELKETLEAIKGQAENHGLELKKLADESKHLQSSNTGDIIKNELIANKDEIAKFVKCGGGHNVTMTMKASTVITSAVSGDTMAMRIPGVGELQRRQPFLRELFSAGGISPNNHGVIRYVDQANRTSSAAARAEGATYAQSDIDWIERNIPIENYGHFIKVSRKMLDDIDFTNTQIMNELITGLNLAIDTDLLTGSGATPILKGVSSVATTFAAGSYANEVQDAQLYDLISVIGAQIMTGAQYIGDNVVVNQLDASIRMKLKKDGENNYILPPFVVNTPQGQMIVDGMRVSVNSGVTANTLYAGDFTKGTVYSGNQLQIVMGFENDDFTKGLVTIRADENLALLIRNVDAGAFRKVTSITDALTAIEEDQA